MRKSALFFLSLALLSLSPAVASADCVDLGDFTSWVSQGEHGLMFYQGERPIALLNIPYCEIRASSTIRLVKSYVCDSDSIMIDGRECGIMTVKALY